LVTGTESAAASDERRARARAEAQEAVHARLTLISCAIWTVGVFASIWVAPSDGWIGIVAAGLFVPAAAVWLARGRMIEAEAERRRRADDALLSGR
jgi:hypothetical protein